MLGDVWWVSGRGRGLSSACLLLGAFALSGCSSDGGRGTTSAGGSGGSGSGGTSAHGGAQGNAGNAGAGGGHAGTSSAGSAGTGANPVTLHETWSTWQLSGTTLTPKTCPELGANTIGFSYNGATLETQENIYDEDVTECASGENDVEWTYGLGDFSLTYGLYPNTFDTEVPIVFTTVPFTVTPTSTVLELPGKIVFTRYPFTWTIQKAGSTATCADVGATSVNILLDQGDDVITITTTFPARCEPNTFNSPPMFPGTYAVSAQLMAGDVQLALWKAPAPLVITADNAPTLPAITFAVP